TPRRERSQLRVRGLFRGQRIERITPVDLYPLAETIAVQPALPQTGSVSVRAPKDLQTRFAPGAGAVAIVLDCAGSMGEAPGRPYTPKTKYNEVTRALREVLQRLPKGTKVSLWVFGQAVGGRKVVEKAEDTVLRIQEPVAWDPDNAAQLKQLMSRVEYPALEPWNESPIVRAILKAKDDVKDAAGFKTIVVLTDGMDNRFAADKEMNPQGKDIPTVLRENFQDSGIVLNIVGFKVVSKEEETARKQFKIIEDFPVPGVFRTVDNVGDLVTTTERALRQKLRYWIDREDNSALPGMPATGLDVSAVGANDQWYPGGLSPGGYKVRVYTD